ncbi:MAG: response regulator [bacterium]|nr:response regulator [bacterium]
MLSPRNFLILCLACLMATFGANLMAQERPHRVLLLHSYHPNMAWTEGVTQGVIEGLRPFPGQLELVVEYMDTKRVFNPQYLEELARLLRLKYKPGDLDLVIASDNNALDFMVQRGSSVFGIVPVVFCGVNFFQPEMLGKGDLPITDVPEEFDALGTIKAALKLQPNLREVLVVADPTPTGVAWANTTREQLRNLKEINLRFGNQGAFESLLDEVKALAPDAAVLFTVYFRDATGQFFPENQALKQLAAASPVPIYGLLNFDLEKGIVGGNLISGYSQGKAATQLVEQVLGGVPANQVPLMRSGVNEMIFDYNMLRRHNLDPSDLPAGSFLINKPKSLVQQNLSLILWVSGFVILQSLVLVYLLWLLNSRRRARAVAQNQEAQYHDLVETLPQGLLELDPKGTILIANQAASELFSVPLTAMIGQPISQFFVPLQSESASELVAELYQGVFFPPVIDAKFYGTSREEHWLELLWSFSPSRDGRSKELTLLVTEVTEQRRVRQQLEEYTLKLEQLVEEKTADLSGLLAKQQLLLDNSMVGIVVTQGRRLRQANKHLLTLTGYRIEEILGEHALDFYGTAEDRDQVFTEGYPLLAQGQTYRAEVQVKRKDGSTFWCSMAGKAIDPADLDKGIIWILIDVTETHQAVEDLKTAMRAAEEAAQIKSDFLARMSHEIRTPMNGIVGMIEFLEGTETTKEQKEALQLMEHSTRTLLAVINDILDFSKIESGKIQPLPSKFALLEELSKIRQLYHLEAQSRVLDFKVFLDPLLPQWIWIDGLRLIQVLSNLLNNACKFTDPGGQVILRCQLASAQELVFEIEDTGIGVPDDRKKAIFMAFEQATDKTSMRFGGSGLGLAISKRLIEMMQGSIRLDDAPKGGALFKVRVPFSPVDPPEMPQTSSETPADLAGLKLLLVEDNLANQKVATKILNRMNAEVEVAENGAEALDKLSRQNFDLVLMDMRMPVMDGIEATQKIRAGAGVVLDSKVPIVALTANAMDQDRKLCLQSGMNDFIAKPFKAQELLETIRRNL